MPTRSGMPRQARRATEKKPAKRPAGTKGAGHYAHENARQLPPEEMLSWQPSVRVRHASQIPDDCKCTWVARTRRIPECIIIAWELKFTYALCPSRHNTSGVATRMSA